VDPPGPASYTPLSVGDMTQLVFTLDSSTTSLEIVGTEERQDGQVVYKGLYKTGTFTPIENYYYVSDGFFIQTELDTVRSIYLDSQVNPFREQRLARSFPETGDTWMHTPSDSNAGYFIATKAESFSTLWGKVDNVYKFDLYDPKEATPFLTLFYGPDLGWIGSTPAFGEPGEVLFACSYKFVSGNYYGQLWPEKDLSPFFKQKHNVSESILFYSLIGYLPIRNNAQHEKIKD
jgi:hypothetical protein